MWTEPLGYSRIRVRLTLLADEVCWRESPKSFGRLVGGCTALEGRKRQRSRKHRERSATADASMMTATWRTCQEVFVWFSPLLQQLRAWRCSLANSVNSWLGIEMMRRRLRWRRKGRLKSGHGRMMTDANLLRSSRPCSLLRSLSLCHQDTNQSALCTWKPESLRGSFLWGVGVGHGRWVGVFDFAGNYICRP